ncbi:MAG: hypothetical protein ACOY46_11130 [Bacillota bacterium]
MIRLPVRNAWFNEREVFFVDAGPTPMRNAHVYQFVFGFTPEGAPIPVEGQYNIADTIPGDIFYSPLWLVNYVVVPCSYTPNSVRSEEEIFRIGYHIKVTGDVSNCPVVPEGTIAPGFETVPAWYKNQQIFYVDFGLFPYRAANFYIFVRVMEGQLVPIQEQYAILDSVPGLPGYSPVWRFNYVFPPIDYMPNAIRSESQLFISGFPIKSTKEFLNCPVLIR